MKKKILIAIPILLIIAYLVGPRIPAPELDPNIPLLTLTGELLEAHIQNTESRTENIRDDNEARILWADETQKTKTEYALVYLHGFSASQGEGIPLHRNFAIRYGCNTYLPRLYGHGIHTENALEDMTPENLLHTAKEAIAIGRQLGKKVILMSTSTGGTISLYLAAHNPDIHSLIMLSPSIEINNPAAFLLADPWGVQIGRLVAGGKNLVYSWENPGDSLYWTKSYRVEGAAYLQALVETTMREEIFNAVKQPVFMGYYYKNEEEQDDVVRVDALLNMFDQLGTSEEMKRKLAFPETGTHVIGCEYRSKDWEGVQQAVWDYMEEVLNLEPVF
ncbi:alpha/beta hydrolase [Bacteroidota bacterium]